MLIGIRSSWVVGGGVDDMLRVQWYALNHAGEELGFEEQTFTQPDPGWFDLIQATAVVALKDRFDSVKFVSLVHDDARCKTGREHMCNECRMGYDSVRCEYCSAPMPEPSLTFTPEPCCAARAEDNENAVQAMDHLIAIGAVNKSEKEPT